MTTLSLVIPVADEPRNLTLPLALGSAQTHAPWLVPVLVGEPTNVAHYLLETPGGRVLLFNQQHPNDPIGNTTAMLRAAVMSPLVTDPFIWSNDDIYFRGPTELDDVYRAGATARGRLQDAPTAGRYGMRAQATLALLQAPPLLRPTWDYERHVPLVVNKSEMAAALLAGPKANPRSMYQNLLLDEPAYIEADVKAFLESDLLTLPPSKFFSSGDRFPLEALRRELGLV